MNAPIPPRTFPNTAGAIADLIRAAAVWGGEAKESEPNPDVYKLVSQSVVQLLAILLQEEPTEEQFAAVFPG